jgi:chromosome partitioning protein
MFARLRASLQSRSRRFHVKHPDEESIGEAATASVATTDAPPADDSSSVAGSIDGAGSPSDLGDGDLDSLADVSVERSDTDAFEEDDTSGNEELLQAEGEDADSEDDATETASESESESESESAEADVKSAEVEATDTELVEPEHAEAEHVEAEHVEAEVAEVEPAEELTPIIFDDTPLARELSEITRRRQALAAETLPLPTETRVFTVANQKGGVGKTTSTVNLAAALARNGARVLVIDLDPQGNASTALGIEHRSETISVYDVIINDEPMSHVVQKSPEFDELYCIPATIHLAGAEIELVSLVAREQRLRTALDLFLAESEQMFHYVFIDCPPSLGLLTINAFVAAKEVLIPIQCEYYALEGLSQLLKNIQLIERHLNPSLSVSTILLTMYDGRTNLANQVAQDVRDHFPDQVLDTLIPRSVRISEAPSYGQSVISYDANSPGSLSYLEAAAEMARRGAPN